MNQFFDRFESTIKQSLRLAAGGAGEGGGKSGDSDIAAQAGALLRYVIGSLHQFAKSGFTRRPTESFTAQRRYLAA